MLEVFVNNANELKKVMKWMGSNSNVYYKLTPKNCALV